MTAERCRKLNLSLSLRVCVCMCVYLYPWLSSCVAKLAIKDACNFMHGNELNLINEVNFSREFCCGNSRETLDSAVW